MWIFCFILVIVSSIVIYNDSKKIGVKKGIKGYGCLIPSSPGSWAFHVFLLWIIYFPLYWILRNKLIDINLSGGQSSGTKKKCPQCAEIVKAEALVCRYCGYKFSADDVQRSSAKLSVKTFFGDASHILLDEIICKNCGRENPKDAKNCEKCDIPLIPSADFKIKIRK